MCERVVSERLKVYVKDWCVQGCVCDRVVCKRGVCKRCVFKVVCETGVWEKEVCVEVCVFASMSPSATPVTQNKG